MEGVEATDGQGVTPRTFAAIFDAIAASADRQFLVRASFLELYNEEIRDLLCKPPQVSHFEPAICLCGRIAMHKPFVEVISLHANGAMVLSESAKWCSLHCKQDAPLAIHHHMKTEPGIAC